MCDGLFFMARTRGDVRVRRSAFLAFGRLTCFFATCFFATCFYATWASAAECPGHPNALGTSRTLVVDPREHSRIGTMQYPETLPLADHEVVLTFDDGPLPRNSNKVLEILADQCVKATFFTIGEMARYSPEGVRKLRDAGHTIGTHSQTHPLSMNHMALERAKQEIDDGIASVKAALGDDADTALAPFFRIPGLLRADNVEEYLASQGIQIWSADFPADDWRHIPSSRVYDLAINRLEAKGKGILLLHDIQARTVAALPRILETLKARGYRIVHVVPATAERPATPTEPRQWLLHPSSDNIAVAHWPKVPNFVFVDVGSLPTPALSDFDHADEAQMLREASLSRPAWPEPAGPAPENATLTLAAPSESLFEVQGNLDVALRSAAFASHRAQKVVSDMREDGSKRISRRESRRLASARQVRLGRATGHQTHHVDVSRQKAQPDATAHPGPLKRLVQVKKRHV
jgi:peptidoglycan/xylan/chitin deacetylase (PgdA/CDA1 family)